MFLMLRLSVVAENRKKTRKNAKNIKKILALLNEFVYRLGDDQ